MKPNDLEITSNPNVLFEKNVLVDEITLNGCRIGDSVHALSFDSISGTGFATYPEKTEGEIWREDKIFVLVKGKEIEFTLEERIQSVVEKGGWIFFNDGSKFGITNQKIYSLSIAEERLSPYEHLKKDDLIRIMGKNVKIKERFDWDDGSLIETQILNTEKQILIYWNDWEEKLDVITLGQVHKEIAANKS